MRENGQPNKKGWVSPMISKNNLKKRKYREMRRFDELKWKEKGSKTKVNGRF